MVVVGISQQLSCMYLRKRRHEVVKLGLLGGGDDLVHADLPGVVAIFNVLCDAAVKQDGLLGHDANLRTQEGHIDASRLMAINQLQEVIDFTISTKQYYKKRAEIQFT